MLGDKVKSMFKAAKKIYGETPETLYISKEDYKGSGLHVVVTPSIPPYILNEYTLGNPRDISKIIEGFRKNKTLKSLYCNMCTLLEPDNFYSRNKFNDLVPEENLAQKLHLALNINNIGFDLSASMTRYFHNHLLLSTVSHVATYFTLLERKYFLAITHFIKEVSQKIPNIKGIFDGTLESDTWHLYLHITDQKLSILEKLKKDLDDSIKKKSTFPVTNVYKRGLVVGRYFISKNPEKVFLGVSSYASNLFGFDRNKLFMGANFLFHKGFYIVFLLTGKKVNTLQIKGQTIGLFLPGYLVNLPAKNPDEIQPSYFQEVFQKINKSQIYQPIKNLKPNKTSLKMLWKHLISLRTPPLEAIEKVFQDGDCNKIDKVARYLGVYQDSFGCSFQGPQCSDSIRASYKFILTLILICFYNRFGPKFYNHLLRDDRFYFQAVNAEIAYMTKTFGIIKTDSMFLRGYVAQAIVQRTFKDLLLISSSKPESQEITIPGTPRIENWINYHFQKLGVASAFGIIVPTNLKQSQQSRFIIKINSRYYQPDLFKEFSHEIAVGLQVNSLRRKIPNFILTLGGFECHGEGDPAYQKLCVPFPNKPMINYMLLELVDSKYNLDSLFTLKLKSNDSNEQLAIFFFTSLAQIMASLAYAQKNKHFTHYDLHAGNVMVYDYQNEEWKKKIQKYFKQDDGNIPAFLKVGFKYKIGNKEYTIPAPLIYIIIDYGSSHVKGLKEPRNDTEWQTPSLFRKSPDVYTLLIYLLFLIIQYRPSLLQVVILQQFYHRFFDTYNSIYNVSFGELIRRLMDTRAKALQHEIHEDLIKIMNNSRKDKKYYLYLPSDFKDIDSPYGSPQGILEVIAPLFPPQVKSDLYYKWGDYSDIGLYIPSKEERERVELPTVEVSEEDCKRIMGKFGIENKKELKKWIFKRHPDKTKNLEASERDKLEGEMKEYYDDMKACAEKDFFA